MPRHISASMKYLISLILNLLALTVSAREPVVYVFSLDSEIDAAAWRHTRRALDAAESMAPPPALFLLKLNTYGGAVDMADSIRTALLRCPIPTAVFIDHNAASAGALIALACDSAYMAPGSSLGAATVVNGNGEPMPPKYQNYWSSVMRSTAAGHGKYIPEGDSVPRWRRDPDLAADMVTPSKAFAYTTDEALKAGLIDGIASDVESVVEQLHLQEARIEYFHPDPTDSFMGFLASAAVRAVLIMLILGGIYMEMHTPGLGIAAAIACVAAVLYFLPMIVAGTLALWVVITFIIGIVLLALEIFVIPGFGIAGITGIIAILAALVGGLLHYTDLGWSDHISLGRPLGILGGGIAGAALLVWFLTSRFGPPRLRRATMLTHEQTVTDGYIGVDMNPSRFVGSTAVAVTPLRPSGKIRIGDSTFDATSTGDFIASGATVKVVRYEAAQLYVTHSSDESNS